MVDPFARARAAWPGIDLDAERFAAAMARCGATEDAVGVEDVYLAEACLAGDPVALRAFTELHAPLVDRVVAKVLVRHPGGSQDAEDVRQALLERLLVGVGGSPAGLASYRGQGPLAAFVRVAALRDALQLMRRARGAAVPLEMGSRGPEAAVDDPEMAALKRDQRQGVRAAFEAILTELDPDDRRLLRYHLIDGYTVREAAVLLGIHYSTVARRVGSLLVRLRGALRRELGKRLGLEGRDLDSFMDLVASRFELSLSRVLASDPETP